MLESSLDVLDGDTVGIFLKNFLQEIDQTKLGKSLSLIMSIHKTARMVLRLPTKDVPDDGNGDMEDLSHVPWRQVISIGE